MGRRNRSAEEQARRTKIRELLHESNISSMEYIRNLFKEPIAEFMENGLGAELEDELWYSRYDYKSKNTEITVETVTAAKCSESDSVMWRYLFHVTERENLSLRYLRKTRPVSANDINESWFCCCSTALGGNDCLGCLAYKTPRS